MIGRMPASLQVGAARGPGPQSLALVLYPSSRIMPIDMTESAYVYSDIMQSKEGGTYVHRNHPRHHFGRTPDSVLHRESPVTDVTTHDPPTTPRVALPLDHPEHPDRRRGLARLVGDGVTFGCAGFTEDECQRRFRPATVVAVASRDPRTASRLHRGDDADVYADAAAGNRDRRGDENSHGPNGGDGNLGRKAGALPSDASRSSVRLGNTNAAATGGHGDPGLRDTDSRRRVPVADSDAYTGIEYEFEPMSTH